MIPPPSGIAPPEADAFAPDPTLTTPRKGRLKLEPRKAPVEILEVDHLEKTPTAN